MSPGMCHCCPGPPRPSPIALPGRVTGAAGSTEPGIRGTALEYLETVLPPPIRQALWPYLGSAPTSKSGVRTLEETREELLRSKESIVLDLGRMTQVRPDGAAS